MEIIEQKNNTSKSKILACPNSRNIPLSRNIYWTWLANSNM